MEWPRVSTSVTGDNYQKEIHAVEGKNKGSTYCQFTGKSISVISSWGYCFTKPTNSSGDSQDLPRHKIKSWKFRIPPAEVKGLKSPRPSAKQYGAGRRIQPTNSHRRGEGLQRFPGLPRSRKIKCLDVHLQFFWGLKHLYVWTRQDLPFISEWLKMIPPKMDGLIMLNIWK